MPKLPPSRVAMEHPYRAKAARSRLIASDRVAAKPRTLRALLYWAHNEYAAECSDRLHGRDLDDGGAPQWSAPFGSHLRAHVDEIVDRDGRSRSAIFAAKDADGYYRYPLSVALERIRRTQPDRANLIAGILPNVYFPEIIGELAGVPAWCVADVVYRSLDMLYDEWEDAPRRAGRKWTDLSESQQRAETGPDAA